METQHSRRHLWVAAIAVSLAAAGCRSDNDGSLARAALAALRTDCEAVGIEAAADAPVVSDELFTLGQALYFDKLLSANQDVSCATCHLATLNGGDARVLPGGSHGTGLGPLRTGGDVVPRNSPTVLNVHLLSTAFWDSKVEPLPGGGLRTPMLTLPVAMSSVLDTRFLAMAAQAMFPPTSRAEMRGALGESPISNLPDGDPLPIWAALTARLLANAEYLSMFQAAYPGTATVDFNFAHVGNAIGAFEVRAFARTDSPFQRFLAGDDSALTPTQIRGGSEFLHAGACINCHTGQAFTMEEHRNIGLPQFGPGKGDGPSGKDDFGREKVTGDPNDRYRFRTAPLLNVELTAPYGHLGQYKTLTDIVNHYRDPAQMLNSYVLSDHVTDPALAGTLLDNKAEVTAQLDPMLRLPREFDVAAIVEFLKSLTADSARDLTDIVPARVPSGLPIDF